jgi:peptide/nickel transport system permease protein
VTAQRTARLSLTVDETRAARRRRLRPRGLSVLVPCGLIVLVFAVVGIVAPIVAPHDPTKVSVIDRLDPPAWEHGGTQRHLLGTDGLGRDELSRLIYGARISLTVVAVTIPLSAVFGTLVGVLAGWFRGNFERVLMRTVDVQLALPALLFAVLLAAIFGPSLRNVIILIIVWSWSGYARVVRGEVLGLRQRDYVHAASAMGAGNVRIIGRHLLPNVVNTVVVLATLEVAAVILIEAALSFLGVGVSITTPSWGAMINEGRNFIMIDAWLIAIPGVAILLISLSGNLLGDWLRDALDPRLRNVR